MATTKKSTKKILICDDEEGVRESLKLILEKDFDLVITDSGAQCIELAKAKNSNLGAVLLDIRMPLVNGLTVLRAIREHRPKMPVLMVTGYKSVEAAAETTRLGANGYIVKPFNSSEILESVRKFMG